jgi:UDP-N-acetylglucosamine--N-acetylmuramyl-(pentapeptide) pyrophosphoryl-undecaprenol N-acetylglucosamine transferase
MGGSMGAKVINDTMRQVIDKLTEKYNIIHICGKGNLADNIAQNRYKQFEYVSDELCDYMALADMVVSRAGSNSINEFLALAKPMLLIPLSRNASRGDQVDNAEDFKKNGYCNVLIQEDMTCDTLLDSIESTYLNREVFVRNMKNAKSGNGAKNVMDTILSVVR